MAYTSPYVPYETGKYILFVFLIIGIILGYRRGNAGWLMLFLLLPSLFIDESGETNYQNIIFNLLGPINVALAIIFFKKQTLSKENFISFLKLMLFPLISVLAYVLIKNPKLDTVDFSLSSTVDTSGGFGGNQISTGLGLGAFLAFLFWRKRWTFSGYRWLDLILVIAFSFQGLLTFSRGGMFGGFLGILIILAFEQHRDARDWASGLIIKLVKIVPVVLLLFFTFSVADDITGGTLLLRYKGETRGTISGRREKDINIITTNRYDIFIDDLKLWQKYPVLGVGPGASSQMRESTRGFLAHVELSRLISEHGILGIIYFIMLLSIGFGVFKQIKRGELNAVLFAFFIIALFTTFHAATRTYVSPLLFGISMLGIEYDPEPDQEDKDTGTDDQVKPFLPQLDI